MVGHSAEYFEVGVKIFAERHDTRDVSAAVAVVRCRPDSNHILRGKMILVALIYQLMGTGNELKVVDVVEL